MVVDREMYDAASELEQVLTRVAVALVLLDCVLDRLLGQAVLQLEGSDRQSLNLFCSYRTAALSLPGEGVP